MTTSNETNLQLEENGLQNNRAFLFGDAVFETVKVLKNKVLFLEDHYFRLMSSMRVLRMEIPMNFTMEYLEEQLLLSANKVANCNAVRVRITVYRNSGGYYLPLTNTISFLIHSQKLENERYFFQNKSYEVDLYKDFFVAKQLLSSLKTTNRIINTIGSIFAQENGLDSCLLLNESKNVIESLQGNIFMVLEGKLITPPISEGCINGIMRKQILQLAKKIPNLEVVEAPISPFELQKADELFITNVIKGIQPITKYRKKEFQTKVAQELVLKLNGMIILV